MHHHAVADVQTDVVGTVKTAWPPLLAGEDAAQARAVSGEGEVLAGEGGPSEIGAAGEIDPVYARTRAEARAAGVQVLAYGCRVEAGGITVERRIGVGTDVV